MIEQVSERPIEILRGAGKLGVLLLAIVAGVLA